jgi:hypothetical protein
VLFEDVNQWLIEVAVAYFNVLSCSSPEENEEKHSFSQDNPKNIFDENF